MYFVKKILKEKYDFRMNQLYISHASIGQKLFKSEF